MGDINNGTKRRGSEHYTRQQMIDALRATKGMVFLAAKQLGCSHTTVYRYIERYTSVRAEKEYQEGQFGDMAELKLYNAVNEEQAWAIQFALRTKFKNRGYIERQEITGADGGNIGIEYVNDWRKTEVSD